LFLLNDHFCPGPGVLQVPGNSLAPVTDYHSPAGETRIVRRFHGIIEKWFVEQFEKDLGSFALHARTFAGGQDQDSSARYRHDDPPPPDFVYPDFNMPELTSV
jgi:hypothetical protein